MTALAAQAAPAPPAPGNGRWRRQLTGTNLERVALPATWIVLIVVFSILLPQTFPTTADAASILSSQAVLLVLTLGVLAPLTVGDLDISAASVAGLSAMIVVILTANDGVNPAVAVAITIVCAGAIGLVNGVCSAVLGIDTLIVTLATGSLVAGTTAWISDNNTITGMSPFLVRVIISDQLWGVSWEFYYGLALCLIMFYVLRFTTLGRRMLIVGQARDVARLSGINVARVRLGSLVCCSAIAGCAGILYAGTSGSAEPAGGTELLLPAYAAAFLGATTINPGRFNPFGSLIAVYFLVTGITGLQLLGAQNYVQQIFYGGALLIAVGVSTFIKRRSTLEKRSVVEPAADDLAGSAAPATGAPLATAAAGGR